jgi:hypothetical protein
MLERVFMKRDTSVRGCDQYRVLVPDLYRGKVGVDAEEASHLMTSLDWAGAIQDISAAAEELDTCGNGSVGVVGFCMGGALSLASAALIDNGATLRDIDNNDNIMRSHSHATRLYHR